jgi:choice-of-anchor C domain-containing protein
VNGSFEGGVYPGTGGWLLVAGSTEITGWVVTPVAISYVGVAWIAADGQRSVDLDGDNPGGIEQSFSTVPGRSYIVKFQMAGNPDPGDPNPATRLKTMRVLAAGQHSDFSFDTNGRTEQDMGWVVHSWSFTADSTTTILEFRSLSPDPNSARGPALDNVVVTMASSGLPTVFSDDFEGTALDSSKWTLVPGNGTVTVSNGKATLLCPSGGIFPYIVPRSNPIPTQGDFVVRVGMRYLSVASAGTGFKGTRDDLDPNSEVAFAYWQDSCCGGHRAVAGTSWIELSQTVDTSYHTYEWRSIQGTCSFYFDGQLTGSGSTLARPTSFFFGHPPVASLPQWSTQELDYVRVERLGN